MMLLQCDNFIIFQYFILYIIHCYIFIPKSLHFDHFFYIILLPHQHLLIHLL